MHALIVALAMSNVFGTAPICSFDGYSFSCYFYSWQQCENAIRSNPSARCVTNPND